MSVLTVNAHLVNSNGFPKAVVKIVGKFTNFPFETVLGSNDFLKLVGKNLFTLSPECGAFCHFFVIDSTKSNLALDIFVSTFSGIQTNLKKRVVLLRHPNPLLKANTVAIRGFMSDQDALEIASLYGRQDRIHRVEYELVDTDYRGKTGFYSSIIDL